MLLTVSDVFPAREKANSALSKRVEYLRWKIKLTFAGVSAVQLVGGIPINICKQQTFCCNAAPVKAQNQNINGGLQVCIYVRRSMNLTNTKF